MKRPLHKQVILHLFLALLCLPILPITVKAKCDLIVSPYSKNFSSYAEGGFSNCVEPTQFNVSNVACRTALATWGAVESNGTIYYEVIAINDVEGTAYSQIVQETECIISGLTPNTNYEVKLRAICEDEDSQWLSKNITTKPMGVCAQPNIYKVIQVATTSALLSWVNDGLSTDYQIEYRATGETTWKQTESKNGDLFVEYTLNNLNPNTEYTVRLRAVCGGEMHSDWVSLTFRTKCMSYLTLPFVENFDNTPGGSVANGLLPSCWSSNYTSSSNRPYVATQTSATSTDFVTALGALNLYYGAATTNIAILPAIDASAFGLAIKDLQVNFKAKVANVASGTLILGIMEDPTDATTFEVVETMAPGTAWKEFTVALTNYSGVGDHIAFMWKNAANYNNALIDDIYIDVITDCPKPVSVKVENTTANSVYFSWVDASSNSWEVVCAPTHTAPNWSTATPLTGNNGNVTGLFSNTKYDLYLRAVCADGKKGFPLMVRFTTSCGEIMENVLPYRESFDQYGTHSAVQYAMPTCWSRSANNAVYINSTNFSAPGSLYFYTNSSATAVTEKFNMEVSTLRLDFILKGSNAACGFEVGVMTDPAVFTSFTPVDTVFIPQAEQWKEYVVYLNRYNGLGQHIAFRVGGFVSTSRNFFMDNLVISKAGNCLIPDRMKVLNATRDEITVQWRSIGNETVWELAYGAPGFNPNSEGTILTANTNPFTISSLTANTVYEIYVRAKCDDEHSEWTKAPAICRTTQTPASIPYNYDFDNVSENSNWILLNGTQTNKWYIGSTTTTDIFAVEKALYITNDNGNSNQYTNATSYVYAFRTIDLVDAGTYIVEFDWRSNGMSMYDELYAFLVPAGIMIEAGNSYGISSLSAPPSNWIMLNASPLCKQTVWQRFSVRVPIAEPAYYNLVFFWKNSLGSGQPAAALDNISIISLACSTPNSLSAKDMTESEATIEWKELGQATSWEIRYGTKGFDIEQGTSLNVTNTPNVTLTELAKFTVYDVYVRAICADDTSHWSEKKTFRTTLDIVTLPYYCDFEDETENDSWGLLNGTQNSQWYIGKAASKDGEHSLYISNTGGATNEYNTTNSVSQVYAVKTFNIATAGKYEMEFDWRAVGESSYDLLRVFLVPTTIALEGNVSYGMGSSNNTKPDNWIDVSGTLNQKATWQKATITFDVPTAGIYNLVFFWKNDGARSYDPPAAVDNVSLRMQTCPRPNNLRVTEIIPDVVTLNWTENGTAINWELQYGEPGFVVGTGATEYAPDTTISLMRLASNFVKYDVYVRAACGYEGESYWFGPVSFRTVPTPETLPYTCDFETDAENNTWGFLNEGQTNQWYIGNAGHSDNGGQKGLFISNDNGYNNTYSKTTSYAYAMKTFNFTQPGIYDIKFDWRAYGFATYDLFRVFLVPSAVKIDAGDAFGMTATTNTTPSGWLDGGKGNLNQKTTWQQENVEMNITTTGVYNLVFFWKNSDVSGGGQPAAAVDNISIKMRSCFQTPSPIIKDITSGSATIEWNDTVASQWEVQYDIIGFTPGNGNSFIATNTTQAITELTPLTGYDVYVRAICGVEDTSHWSLKSSFKTSCISEITQIPYSENFDYYANEGAIPTTKRDVFPHCWTSKKSTYADNEPYIANLGAGNQHSTPYALDFGYTADGYSIAVLPAIDAAIVIKKLQLSFWGRSGIGGNGTLYVGVMDDPAIDSTFTIVSTYKTPSFAFLQRTVNFQFYTGKGRYIAFKWEDAPYNKFLLDDVILSYFPTICPSPHSVDTFSVSQTDAVIQWLPGGEEESWIVEYKKASEAVYDAPVSVTTTSFNCTNLMANTDYDIRIRANCNDLDTSQAVIYQFKTTAIVVPDTFLIEATCSAHGDISPKGSIKVVEGSSQIFTFIPDSAYVVDFVLVDGDTVDAGTSYTITNVTTNKTIHVEFKYIATGIGDREQLNNSVHIYPNPTSDILKVRLTTSFEQIEVINLLGQTIYTDHITEQELEINVDDYRQGIYFIRFSGKQGVVTKKFVKK